MTPALPKRLFVGLPTTVALATLVLALAGSTSSESLPLPPTRIALGLDQLILDLPGALRAAPGRPAALTLERPSVAPPDLAELRRVVAGRYLETLPYGNQIRRAARSQRVDGLLVASVVEAESSFRPDAVSDKGALGLMQLMPDHLEGVEQPLDPTTNLTVGSSYLSRLSRLYEGNLELALAAYHAGPGAVRKFGGVPPYRSTRSYVSKVMGIYRAHRRAVDLQVTELGRPGIDASPEGEAQRGS